MGVIKSPFPIGVTWHNLLSAMNFLIWFRHPWVHDFGSNKKLFQHNKISQLIENYTKQLKA